MHEFITKIRISNAVIFSQKSIIIKGSCQRSVKIPKQHIMNDELACNDLGIEDHLATPTGMRLSTLITHKYATAKGRGHEGR